MATWTNGTEYKGTKRNLLVDNYIYISHLDKGLKFWRLPVAPDTISDNMQSTFNSTNALGRSAPVYTFSNAGPRTVSITLKMHREMMNDINNGTGAGSYSNNATFWRNGKKVENSQGYGEDYMDNLIKALQAIAVPKYNLTNKAVEPPLVALRLGNEIFIKGVVTSGINITYGLPILYNGKYAEVTLQLVISEVDPFDATSVYKNGGFRGVLKTFRTGMNISDDIGD